MASMDLFQNVQPHQGVPVELEDAQSLFLERLRAPLVPECSCQDISQVRISHAHQ